MADDNDQLYESAYQSFKKQNGREPNAQELADTASKLSAPAPAAAPVQQMPDPTAQAPAPIATQPPAQAPQQGGVQFTPPMEQTAQRQLRDVLGGPDSQVNPLNEFSRGVSEVPETLENAALGAGQQVLNVPQNKRLTAADLLRMIPGNDMTAGLFGPGYVGPSELPQSQAYQQAMQKQSPVMQGVNHAASFGGSVAFPLGAAEQALTKIPQSIPIVQKLGQLVAGSNAAKALSALKAAKLLTMAQSNPILHGALSGAGYGPVFGAGQQFGQNRTLPTPQQAGGQALAGGVTGGGIGAIAKALQSHDLMGFLQKQAPGFFAQPAAGAATKQVLPEAPVVQSGLSILTHKNLARNTNKAGQPRTPEHKADVQQRIFQGAIRKYAPESEEHHTAVMKAQEAYEKANYRESIGAKSREIQRQKTLEGRTYSEGQKQQTHQRQDAQRQDNRDHSQRQLEGRIDRKVQQTGASGQTYRAFSQQIDGAQSKGDLQAIWPDIHDPGSGEEGGRLLDSAQQADLKSQWYRKRRALGKKNGEAPGESPEPPTTSPTETPKTNSPAPETKPPIEGSVSKDDGMEMLDWTTPETKTPTETPKTQPEPAKAPDKTADKSLFKLLVENFRKTFNPKLFGDRKNRFQLAVSADTLFDAAGLGQAEKTAMHKWIGEISETRRELTYKEKQIEELVRWADKNEDEWIGTQNKVKLDRKSDDQGASYKILEHTEREGRYKRLAMRAKMEHGWEEATQQNLEHVTRKKADGTEELVVEAKPHLEATTNGIANKGDWQESQTGQLLIKGGIKEIKLPAFKPPKSADELFARLEDLMEWRSHFRKELGNIKNAVTLRNEGNGNIIQSWNHLGNKANGDPITPTDVMEKVFEHLKMPWINGKAPNTHIWHVDDADHVSTVNFHQARTTANMQQARAEVDAKLAKVDKLLAQVTDKDGKIDYDALWANKGLMAKLHAYFPGLEAGIIATMLGRPINKIGKGLVELSGVQKLFAGTIDNVLRDNPRYGGQELSDSFHQMLGEISSNFLTDKTGEWHPIRSAEEQAELLNDFKGAKIQRSAYRKKATELAEEEAAKNGGTVSVPEQTEAIRRADTAFMIRQKQQKFAAQVQKNIDEMAIRKADSKTGVPSKEGRKFYTNADLDEQGRVRVSAYNQLYHEALQDLHGALTLQSKDSGGFFGNLPSRTSRGIMANNPRVAVKNLFDQAAFTLAYYHYHFMNAVIDINSNPEIAEAFARIPTIPQVDMSLVKQGEALKDTRAAENVPQKLAKLYQGVNHFLSVQLDPFFKGHAPLVSLADRMVWSKYSGLASVYKSAAQRGVDRHEFVDDLINNRLPEATHKAVMAELSHGLSETLNVVRPDLNQDLYAGSAPGKITAAYSTPGRRAMKLQTQWFKEALPNAMKGDPSSALKLIASFGMTAAVGGSGAVPQSIQFLYKASAAAFGQNEQAERNLQSLNNLNILKKLGFSDWSENFGPDFLTNAQPAIQNIQKIPGAVQKAVTDAKTPVELAWNTSAAILLDGLHMFPQVGGAGYDVWKGGVNDMRAAAGAQKDQYFTHNGQLAKVPIFGYTFADAMHDWMIGGTNLKAVDAINAKKIQYAQQEDAKYRANKSIMPTRENSGAIPFLPDSRRSQ